MKKRKRRLKKKIKICLLLIVFFVFIFFVGNNKLSKSLLNENNFVYLALDDTYNIKYNYEGIIWESSDENIAVVKNGVVTPKNVGKVSITAKLKKNKESILFDISDLYIKPEINNNKDYLPCGEYSKEENDYLDNVLKYKIGDAGYKTRAGVVAAARFLTLEFKYRLAYFYENGRLLTNNERDYVDGEGRYYHVGLYLHDSRYKNILASMHGPSIWGCNMYTETLEMETPNGLDCSGFVSWVLLNAGFDVGDAGAGIDEDIDNDLDDLGEKIKVTEEGLEREYKVGDLISRYAHIGIIIGIDGDKTYVAEALDYDLHVLTYTKEELIESDWYYIILMDEIYQNDGNLTNMW